MAAVAAPALAARMGEPSAAYAAEVARRLRGRLGDGLVGAWLTGSAVLGDFAPDRSDIDIQAVTGCRLPPQERRRLAAALDHAVLRCPARGLELVLYAREDLTAPAGPAFQLNLNTGRGMHEHVALDPEDDPGFWFTIDVAITREHGVALGGPPPRSVLPELPRARIVSALRDALAWHAAAGAPAADAVLNACRAWAWASDGRWLSKQDAAHWADSWPGDLGSIAGRALRLRETGAGAPPAPHEVKRMIAAARAALDAGRR